MAYLLFSAFFFYWKVYWCGPTSFLNFLFLKMLHSSLECWYWIICLLVDIFPFFLSFFFFFYFWPRLAACRILVPRWGDWTAGPRSPSHWTTREFPQFLFIRNSAAVFILFKLHGMVVLAFYVTVFLSGHKAFPRTVYCYNPHASGHASIWIFTFLCISCIAIIIHKGRI